LLRPISSQSEPKSKHVLLSVWISWFGVRMKCIILFDGSVLGITLVLTGTDQLSDYVNRKMEEKKLPL
jgi:hypothetical protein